MTEIDLDELEALLREVGGSSGDIARARGKHKSLAAFARSLVGMDRAAVQQAFVELIAGTTMSANQLQFIDEVINHLTEHGAMPAERLYTSPFSDIHVHGPDGIFAPQVVDALFVALGGLELKAG